MRKAILVLSILFFYGMVNAQCPQGDITLNTQQAVDDFAVNYPDCTELNGALMIEDFTGTNLNGLNRIISIQGKLEIVGCSALTNLSGLDSLTSIGGFLQIGKEHGENDVLNSLTGLENLGSVDGYLGIAYNHDLVNLTGLENLTSIGGNLSIYRNDALIDMTNLESLSSIDGDLVIYYNDALASLTGLESVSSIGGDLRISGSGSLINLTGLENLTSIGKDLHIEGSNDLINLTGLENLTSIAGGIRLEDTYLQNLSGLGNLSTVGGNVEILSNDSLINLEGLGNLSAIFGKLEIDANSSLINLEGLENLSSVGDRIYICSNDNLISLEGLEGFNIIESLIIRYNDGLINLQGLENVNTIESLSIGYNDGLINLQGLENVNIIESLSIGSNPNLLEINQLAGITSDTMTRLSIINNDALTNIDGFESVTKINSELYISSNQNLNNLDGLMNLNHVGYNLTIKENDALLDISGLDNLSYIGGSLRIEISPIMSIEGFNNLTYIGGGLRVQSNDNLTSITGFSNLNAFSYSGIDIFNNMILNDISGLSGIDSLGPSVRIVNNPNLAVCALPNICNYLISNGGGSISGNAEGCANANEILANCFAEFCLVGGITFTTQTQIDSFATDYAGCMEIVGDVVIDDSGVDPIINLDGLYPITVIQGNLTIQNNPSLTNLSGLSNVTAIEGAFTVNSNSVLTSLSEIGGIDYLGFTDIQIQNNSNLSVCSTPNICQYVAFNDTAVFGNASGCNSEAEIIASCDPIVGTVDTDFGTDGIITIPDYEVRHMLTQPDDKLVIFGTTGVLRLNADGTFDTSFGTNGVVSISGSYGILQPDGKIIVKISSGHLGRLNTDGTLDATFGTGGISSLVASASGIALGPDGKIVTSSSTLARYNADGSVDTSFGDNGIVPISIEYDFFGQIQTIDPYCQHVVVKSDNKIVVSGGFSISDGPCDWTLQVILGYNVDGTPDESFNNWAEEIIYTGDTYTSVEDLYLLPNDEFVILTDWNEKFYGWLDIERYDANGIYLAGSAYGAPCGHNYSASWSSATVSDCGIFATAGFVSYDYESDCDFLTRTDFNGTIFRRFGYNGFVESLPFYTRAMTPQSDGGLIMASGIYPSGIRLTRLHNDETCGPLFPFTSPSTNSDTPVPQHDSTLNLFPIPTDKLLNIEYLSENSNSTNIEILSNEGKIMMLKQEFLKIGSNTIQLDIDDLPAGHYHIRMYNAEDMQMQSFVKM